MDKGLDLWEAEKAISITYPDCVSFALVIQYSMFMHHVVICGLSVSTFFYSTIFRKKLLNMKGVL